MNSKLRIPLCWKVDGRQVTLMAWNGSNGIFIGQPGYVPYTSWRNTPGEAAMRDFMVTHANLAWGARLWTFGAPGYADDDGWRMEGGRVSGRGGYVDLEWSGEDAVLVSPGDQVIRAGRLDRLVLGFMGAAQPIEARAYARVGPDAVWEPIGSAGAGKLRRMAAGWVVPLAWGTRRQGAIYESVRVVVRFAPGTKSAQLERVALLPRKS